MYLLLKSEVIDRPIAFGITANCGRNCINCGLPLIYMPHKLSF